MITIGHARRVIISPNLAGLFARTMIIEREVLPHGPIARKGVT